jgi:hypothetical protein
MWKRNDTIVICFAINLIDYLIYIMWTILVILQITYKS